MVRCPGLVLGRGMMGLRTSAVQIVGVIVSQEKVKQTLHINLNSVLG